MKKYKSNFKVILGVLFTSLCFFFVSPAESSAQNRRGRTQVSSNSNRALASNARANNGRRPRARANNGLSLIHI